MKCLKFTREEQMEKILKVECIDDLLDKRIIFYGETWKKEFHESDCIRDRSKDYEIKGMMFKFLLDNAIHFKDEYHGTELYVRMTSSFYSDYIDKKRLLKLLYDAIVKEDELAIYSLKFFFIELVK